MVSATVRIATHEDIPRVIAIISAGALPIRPDDADGTHVVYREAFEEIAANPNQAIVVAEVDGQVVGTLQFVAFRHLHRRGGRCAEVEAVHVVEAMRGKGIGAKLMEWAIAEARRRGCYRIQLTSQHARDDAHRFYARLGFTGSHVGYKLALG